MLDLPPTAPVRPTVVKESEPFLAQVAFAVCALENGVQLLFRPIHFLSFVLSRAPRKFLLNFRLRSGSMSSVSDRLEFPNRVPDWADRVNTFLQPVGN
jgi:hypothetical protein